MNSGETAQRQWRKLAADQIRHKEWGDDVVVYVHSTGDTHLLEAFYARLWAVLSETPRTLGQLGKALGNSVQEGSDFAGDFREALDGLEQIGLVSSSTK